MEIYAKKIKSPSEISFRKIRRDMRLKYIKLEKENNELFYVVASLSNLYDNDSAAGSILNTFKDNSLLKEIRELFYKNRNSFRNIFYKQNKN